jgi:hypothetical protein
MNYKLNIFASFSSATNGGILDRAIEAEDSKHGDFLRLVKIICITLDIYLKEDKKETVIEICVLILQDHVEGYLELSAKTKTYFATAVNLWDADFYIKVDDDVHVNIGIKCYSISKAIFI